MKKLAIITGVATLIAAANFASAASIVLSNAVNGSTGDTLIQNADGSLMVGGTVAVGYFPAGYDLTGGLSQAGTYASDFNIFTSSAVGGDSPSLGGSFAGYYENSPVDVGTITAGNDLLGRPLYLFVGNAATLESSTAFALSPIGVIADDNPFPQTYTSNQPPAPVGDIGTVGVFTGDASGFGEATYATLQLSVIPEPSTLLLGMVGFIGLLRRRR